MTECVPFVRMTNWAAADVCLCVAESRRHKLLRSVVVRYVIWRKILHSEEQSRCYSREETVQGQYTSPGGPLNNVGFRAAIAVGQIYYSQQLNRIQHKVLPRKFAELLSTHLTICVQCVQILYLGNFVTMYFLHSWTFCAISRERKMWGLVRPQSKERSRSVTAD